MTDIYRAPAPHGHQYRGVERLVWPAILLGLGAFWIAIVYAIADARLLQ